MSGKKLKTQGFYKYSSQKAHYPAFSKSIDSILVHKNKPGL